ncbi:MAG: hypothetical protein IJB50_03970 [Clostridia bacterium]|nr:hypothetical protein [Clostridia bacterium]
MKQIKMADVDAVYSVIEETVKSGNDIKIKISGFSMYPLVSSRRDSVLLTKAENIKKGDVPFFKRDDGSYVLHRIVGIKNGAYKVRGDYEQKIEYPVYPEQVIAVAKGFYRNEKYIACDSFLYKLYSFFWMRSVAIRPIMLKILAIRSSLKDKRKSKNENNRD